MKRALLMQTRKAMPCLVLVIASAVGCGRSASEPKVPADTKAAEEVSSRLPAKAGEAGTGESHAGTEALAATSDANDSIEFAPAEEPAATEPETITDPQLWASAENWPMFRGSPLAAGVARSSLPDKPEVLWKVQTPEGSFEGTAIIVAGTIYVGNLNNGYLYAFNLADGSEKWKFKTELGFYAAPALRNGNLYIGDSEGRFYCLDAATGTPKWGHSSQAEIDNSANFHGDNVIYGSQDSHLYCLNANTGAEVWTFAIEDQIRCFPTVVGDRSFVAGCDSKFHIVNLTDGTEVASVDIEAPTGASPAVSGDLVYFGTEGEAVFCINWREAKVVWKYRDPKKHMPYRSSAALAPATVVIGSRDKQVRALGRGKGLEQWRFPTRGRVDSSPVIVGNRAFIGSSDGRLYAIDIDSGQETWSYEAGGGFSASPAVAAGRLVIGNEDGTLYCFGAK